MAELERRCNDKGSRLGYASFKRNSIVTGKKQASNSPNKLEVFNSSLDESINEQHAAR